MNAPEKNKSNKKNTKLFNFHDYLLLFPFVLPIFRFLNDMCGYITTASEGRS